MKEAVRTMSDGGAVPVGLAPPLANPTEGTTGPPTSEFPARPAVAPYPQKISANRADRGEGAAAPRISLSVRFILRLKYAG